MAEPNRVIDLRTRTTYTPDYAALARNRLVLARRSLGLTAAEFAAMLTPMVGWPVTPEAVAAWESHLVPPGDVLIAVSTITPVPSDQLGVRSHKFIAAHVGRSAVTRLLEAADPAPPSSDWLASRSVPAEHPAGTCTLHVWPFGVAVFHLVEDLEFPNIAHLALWRYQSYEENLGWAAAYLRDTTGDSEARPSYVLSLYWVHRPIWVGRMLDTALRIICAPRVLIEREHADWETSLAAAEQVERGLLAEGFEHHEMLDFGLKGVSVGYASWSGVTYHPLDPARSLSEEELVACELKMQAIWAYCQHINGQVEQGRDPVVADGFGWHFLRGARSRLSNPRPQETGQHRSMRDAILETSGLKDHLHQAIEALREAGKQ